jgi:hypothetical protein
MKHNIFRTDVSIIKHTICDKAVMRVRLVCSRPKRDGSGAVQKRHCRAGEGHRNRVQRQGRGLGARPASAMQDEDQPGHGQGST